MHWSVRILIAMVTDGIKCHWRLPAPQMSNSRCYQNKDRLSVCWIILLQRKPDGPYQTSLTTKVIMKHVLYFHELSDVWIKCSKPFLEVLGKVKLILLRKFLTKYFAEQVSTKYCTCVTNTAIVLRWIRPVETP